MASLSTPLQSSTAYSSTSTLSSCPFSTKPSQFYLSAKRNYRQFTVSCKNNESHEQVDNLDRRDVLLGLGGLYGASNLIINPFAMAAPIAAPEISKCGPPADLPPGAVVTDNCCPPVPGKVIDYKLPPPPKVNRFRPAAHLVKKDYIEKLNKAVELMKALPADDPRNFTQQANVHCAYCNGAYVQPGSDQEISVHYSWLFFPFHRWYLYFYERILGKLIGDPSFGLPFWNWDNIGGMTIPSIFMDQSSALYNENRNQSHLPPTVVDLGYNGTDRDATCTERIENNLAIMYRQMVSNATTGRDFFGKEYRAGDEPNAFAGAGSIEASPHIPLHRWVGDPRQPNGEDLGNFYSAGRDVLFYSHHANVDRMWTIWQQLGGKRKEVPDPDWLNSSFIFYDENAQPVRVKVRDSFSNDRMGYIYEKVDIPWLKNKPVPRVRKSRVAFTSGAPPADKVFPGPLNKIVKVLVKRPKLSRSKRQKEEEEERLVVYGIEFSMDKYVKFDVFINDEDDNPNDFAKSEYVGSFANLPHKVKSGMKAKTTQTFELTEILEDLDVEDDDALLVTLVPNTALTIDGIKIEVAT
ncbi:polyphenol oxidase I, chloroplastic-like [Coffea arabica]|uniref:Polyphenol oxidase I, chloroplastic-like n=1 Tax=Coffea arabica TaxID=13443 RepID=A0A6P6SD00_COFAR|nr:polyphenol oxidase I, chloroplastic-like [Coffea arabica]XP_027064015.1 polyphenol oxidase I, chloroplastic-like [Coffea arabica]